MRTYVALVHQSKSSQKKCFVSFIIFFFSFFPVKLSYYKYVCYVFFIDSCWCSRYTFLLMYMNWAFRWCSLKIDFPATAVSRICVSFCECTAFFSFSPLFLLLLRRLLVLSRFSCCFLFFSCFYCSFFIVASPLFSHFTVIVQSWTFHLELWQCCIQQNHRVQTDEQTKCKRRTELKAIDIWILFAWV